MASSLKNQRAKNKVKEKKIQKQSIFKGFEGGPVIHTLAKKYGRGTD